MAGKLTACPQSGALVRVPGSYAFDEEDWLACTDPYLMLDFLQLSPTSDRKLRLFACACFRRNYPELTQQRVQNALHLIELYAEGFRSRKHAYDAAEAAGEFGRDLPEPGQWQTRCLRDIAWQAGWVAAWEAMSRAELFTFDDSGQEVRITEEIAPAARESELRAKALLLKHVVGNPFSKGPAARWPTTVLELARAVDRGESCLFALHHALLEAGHAELAEHFREPIHPKGCWALDLILGKN
jgi:hypothetical protein